MSILDSPASPPNREGALFARRVRTARRYYLDLATPRSTPLAVICGGYEECSPDYAVCRPEFPYYVVEWVARGRGSTCLAGRRRELGVGSLFTYGPGVAHEIEANAAEPLVKHFVCFTGTDSSRLLADAGLAPGTLTMAPKGADLPWLFESLWHDGSRGGPSAAGLCVSLLRYLLAKVTATPAGSHSIGALATYERCDAYVVEHAEELHSLDEFAAACGVDPAYLCRIYKRYSQQTPYGRLLRLKMHTLAERLMLDARPFRVVASECGYADPYLLSRQFKRVFGVSPSVFRRLR